MSSKEPLTLPNPTFYFILFSLTKLIEDYLESYFFVFITFLPYILFPVSPADSGDLDELSWTRGNLFCIAVHFVLCILQLGFILAIPLMVLLPIWTAVIAVALFFGLNHALCLLINGKGVEFHSDPKYAPALPEHAHEQWIFINGVAAG